MELELVVEIRPYQSCESLRNQSERETGHIGRDQYPTPWSDRESQPAGRSRRLCDPVRDAKGEAYAILLPSCCSHL